MAIQNPYDHALKILARTWPDHFLRLCFPNQSVRLIGTTSNVELALEIDRVDFLHEFELGGESAYFHIDFQLEHEEDCKRRFFVYNGMLTEMMKPRPVITLPVYLRPREKELPNQYEVKVGGVLFHTFTYQPIKLWHYVDQIRSGELYIFAPLLPVLTRPMNEALLVEERELILNNEVDPARQRTLLTTAILIAAQSKLFASDFLWELFKGDPMDLDNPVIAKLFDRAYGQKLAEEIAEVKQTLSHEVDVATRRALDAEAAQHKAEAARREAEAEAARREAEAEAARHEAEAEAAKQWLEMVFKVLEHRFTSAPIALSMLLQSVPSDQRSAVIDIILEASTGETCLAAIRELLNQPTRS